MTTAADADRTIEQIVADIMETRSQLNSIRSANTYGLEPVDLVALGITQAKLERQAYLLEGEWAAYVLGDRVSRAVQS